FSPMFFFTLTSTPVIYALSLHDALPISLVAFAPTPLWAPYFFAPVPLAALFVAYALADGRPHAARPSWVPWALAAGTLVCVGFGDRKSTRLNSSHVAISYAAFCLNKQSN